MSADPSQEEMRAYRGSLTEAGQKQPVSMTARSEENLKLFEEMRAGKYEQGAKTLRAKI